MLSKYGMICEVADNKSFSYIAKKYGYAQSSISQAIKSLEDELGVQLIDRKRHDITWTADGLEFEPYIRAIYNSELALENKKQALKGLENAVIRIGTFTSVSRDTLPMLMTEFKKEYPSVRFELHQGDYNNIGDWLRSDTIDLGFLSSEMTEQLPHEVLYQDEMLAVLPLSHPLGIHDRLDLSMLTDETIILLDEGEYSTTLAAFKKEGLNPNIEYTVYDDYSILSMVKNNLGISFLFKNVIKGYEKDVAVRPLTTPINRTVCLACHNEKTLSNAARSFRDFTINRLKQL